jgi:tetratricopeptide repeat protein
MWWVRAEDPGAIDAEFRTLLELLLPPGEAAKIGDARAKAFALLAQQKDPWLLVLDNVPDPAAANGLLPPAGNGHCLITSRATGFPNPHTVQPLGTDAAVDLLISQSGDNDREAAKALATELGGLPLALTQAAGFVKINAVNLAKYLDWYRERSAELLKKGRPADYPHTVATTWQLAMDRLTPTARALLNLLAFYAPDAIPVHLLTATNVDKIEHIEEIRPLRTDDLARAEAIGELCSHSLITPAGSDTVTVHRLVQAATRNRLGAELVAHEWVNAAHALITAAMPTLPATAINLAAWDAIRTHVQALLEHVPPDHPDTLITRHELANWTGEKGDAARARDLLAALLPIRERVSGAEHPDTLNTQYNLARWAGQAGDAERARDLLAELLPIRERVFGAEHPDTLNTRHYLASWAGTAGNPARARDLLAELLFVSERALGTEHPHTLNTRHELACWTGAAGNKAHARDLFAELLPIYERVLGTEHPDTLTTRHELAFRTGRAGDAERARDLFAELLPIRERIQGTEHPGTLTTRHSLAYFTGEAGDAIRARDLLTVLLPIRERVLGAEHPETLTTRRHLAYWTDQAGG